MGEEERMSTPEERALARIEESERIRERKATKAASVRNDVTRKRLEVWRQYFAAEREQDYPHALPYSFICCVEGEKGSKDPHPHVYSSRRIAYEMHRSTAYGGTTVTQCILPEEYIVHYTSESGDEEPIACLTYSAPRRSLEAYLADNDLKPPTRGTR